MEIIYYLGNGHTYIEISEKLGISIGAVKKHISSAIKKVGAKNSAHTIKLLYEQGHLGSDNFAAQS